MLQDDVPHDAPLLGVAEEGQALPTNHNQPHARWIWACLGQERKDLKLKIEARAGGELGILGGGDELQRALLPEPARSETRDARRGSTGRRSRRGAAQRKGPWGTHQVRCAARNRAYAECTTGSASAARASRWISPLTRCYIYILVCVRAQCANHIMHLSAFLYCVLFSCTHRLNQELLDDQYETCLLKLTRPTVGSDATSPGQG